MSASRLASMMLVGLLAMPAMGSPQQQPRTTLPETIPIFPLPDVVLFPRVSQPLHIFEERYRAMIADALEGDRIIGMVLLRPGFEADYDGRPPIHPIGCAGVITNVERLADGRFDIVLEGRVKFRVTGEDDSRAYRLAKVEALPEVMTPEDRVALQPLRRRIETLITAGVASDALSGAISLSLPDEALINTLARYVPLDTLERQKLLEQPGAVARARLLLDLLTMK